MWFVPVLLIRNDGRTAGGGEEEMLRNIPMKAFGTGEDVANAVAFLQGENLAILQEKPSW